MAQLRCCYGDLTDLPNVVPAQLTPRTSSNTPPDDRHVFVMTGDDTTAPPELQAIAGEAFALLDTGHQIPPFSVRFSALDLNDAYRVTAAIRQMREMRG